MAEHSSVYFLVDTTWYEYTQPQVGTNLVFVLTNDTKIGLNDPVAISDAIMLNRSLFEKVETHKVAGSDKEIVKRFKYNGVAYGLYYEPQIGKWLINPFSGQADGGWFGRDGKVQSSAQGIRLFLKGHPQTIEYVKEDLNASFVARDEFKKREHERESKAGRHGNVSLYQNGFKDAGGGPKTEEEKAIEEAAKQIAIRAAIDQEERVYQANRDLIAAGAENGEISFITLGNTGKYNVAPLLKQALEARGIIPSEMSERLATKIGITYGRAAVLGTNGIRFLKKDETECPFEACGIMINLDEGSAQLRNLNKTFIHNFPVYTYVSKADEKEGRIRFTTLGPAYPFGLVDAVNNPAKRPLIIVEGAFDAISIDNVSGGKLDAVALQGAQNQTYIMQNAQKLRDQNRIVFMSLDGDSAGAVASREAMAKMAEDGVMVVRNHLGSLTIENSDGTLKNKDFNELLQNDRESLRSLASILSLVGAWAQKRFWSVENVNKFFDDIGCDHLVPALTKDEIEKGKVQTSGIPVSKADLIKQEVLADYILAGGKKYLEEGGTVRSLEYKLYSFCRNLKTKENSETMEEKFNRRNLEGIRVLRATPDNVNYGGVIPDAETQGLYHFDTDLKKALLCRGIYNASIPEPLLDRIGLVKSGLITVSEEGVSSDAEYGILYELDNRKSYLLDRMAEDTGETKVFAYDGGAPASKLRLIGESSTFGLENALNDNLPILFTRDFYDAFEMMNMTPSFNAVALQSRETFDSIREHINELKEKNVPIIIPLPPQDKNDNIPPSVFDTRDLYNDLYEAGCPIVYMPSFLGYRSFSVLHHSDYDKNGNQIADKAERYVDVLECILDLLQDNALTKEKTEEILSAFIGDKVSIGDGTSYGYAGTILQTMEGGVRTALKAGEGSGKTKDETRLEILTYCDDILNSANGREYQRRERPSIYKKAEISITGGEEPLKFSPQMPNPAHNMGSYVYSVGDDDKYRKEYVTYEGEEYNFQEDDKQVTLHKKENNAKKLAGEFEAHHDGMKVLEISPKSDNREIGKSLSAFNLSAKRFNKSCTVEALYQGSKIFEGVNNEEPNTSWYTLSSVNAKRAAREANKEHKLLGFKYVGADGTTVEAPLATNSMFYNWLYVTTLCQAENDNLRGKLLAGNFNAFTDIESTPNQYACQAEAVSIFCSLERTGKLQDAMRSFDDFYSIVTSKDLSGNPRPVKAAEKPSAAKDIQTK